MPERQSGFIRAMEDFQRARRSAALEQVFARLRRKPTELLSYEDVRQKLKARAQGAPVLTDIPIEAIVGSVGRYADFTRSFLPKQGISVHRWVQVKTGMEDMAGLPPIEVYKIGDAYFVSDGNHRVSVAKATGATHIQGYVTEVQTRVPFAPDATPDDIILKAEQVDFLNSTRLDELRPGLDVTVTAPGQYDELEEHISVHRYFMGLEQQREISYDEAVASWCDHVFRPIVALIEDYGLLRAFPGRTPTDLYLWLAEHRAAIEEELGLSISPERAVAEFAGGMGANTPAVVAPPDPLSPQANLTQPGIAELQAPARFLADILVPVSGEEVGWCALEQALALAQREQARLVGLHVTPDDELMASEPARAIQEHFNRRCREANIAGELVLAVGDIGMEIRRRAVFTDLLVVNLAHPPGRTPLARLGSGFRALLRRCPAPVLVTPGVTTALDRLLVAYDASPNADKALAMAAYFAGRHHLPLIVLAVEETSAFFAGQARSYLESRDIPAEYVTRPGPIAAAILSAAEEHECNVILMGSYRSGPIAELVSGGNLDEVLRNTTIPVWVCR